MGKVERRSGDRRRKRRSGGVAYPVGAQVEVRIDDYGFRGAWYEATVAHRLSHRRFEIVYASILDDHDPSQPLREAVLSSHVRPRPPPRPPVLSCGGAGYGLHDLVEAFHNDGWWAGVISGVLHGPATGRYLVSFPTSREEVDVEASQVRPQLQWVRGRWVPVDHQGTESAMFAIGAHVEVSRDRGNYGEAWYEASVIKVLSSSTFLVEYESLKAESNGEWLTEFVDAQYIRTCQPNAVQGKDFALNEEVEVLHHGGWAPGMILDILDESRCIVKFMHTGKEMEFDHAEMRHRRYWDGQQWLLKIQIFQQGTRKSLAKPVSGKQNSQAAKRYSLPISVSTSSDDGEVTREPSSTKLFLKRKKAEVQLESSHAFKNLKKVKSLEYISRPRCSLLSGGPATPMSEIIDHCASMATTLAPNSVSSELLYANHLSIPELPFREEGPPGEGLEHQAMVTQGDGAPSSNEANCFLRLEEQRNYKGVRGLTVNVRKRRTKLVIGSRQRQKKAINDDGVGQQSQVEGNKRSREKHSTRCYSSMCAPIRWELTNSKKSATNDVIGSNCSRHKDELSGQGLCGDKSLPLCQHNEILMLQGPSSIVDIVDSAANDAISIYRANKQVDYGPYVCLTPQRVPLTAGNSSIKCLIAQFSPDVIPCSFKTVTSGVILHNARVCTEDQIIPSVPGENCTEINQNREPSEMVILEDEGSLFDPSSNGSPVKDVPLPFPKTSSVWEMIELMEVFQAMPQQPHFRPLQQYSMEFREGMAIGLMVSFANLVGNMQQLRIDDAQATLEERLKALDTLEANGFKVDCLRSRLQELFEIQINQSQCKTKKAELEAKILEKKDENDRLESLIAAFDKAITELEQNLASFQERRDAVILQRSSNGLETSKLEMGMHEAEEACNSAKENFNTTLSAPW